MNIVYHHRTQGTGAEGVHIAYIIKGFRNLGHTVNVRAGPSTSTARITTLTTGTGVSVLETVQDGKWYRIARGGEELGYVYAPLLKPAGD